VFIAAIFIFQNAPVAAYLEPVDAIITSANADLSTMNSAARSFNGDPKEARALASALTTAATALRDDAGKLRAITPPRDSARYHQALIDYYVAASDLCAEMAGTTGYIAARGDSIASFATAVQSYEAAMQKARSGADVVAASKAFKAVADRTLSDLKALKRPRDMVLSDKALQSYLTELSAVLLQIQKGVDTSDPATLQAALARLQQIFAVDWGKALVERDKAGLAAFARRANDVDAMRRQLEREFGAAR